MQHALPPKSFRFLSLVTLFLIGFQLAGAQTSASTPIRYVRMDIGHGGLHCPFLGPRLEQGIKALNGIQNLKVDIRASYATFELPTEPVVSDVQLKELAVKVGYPPADVTVIISDKEIENPASKN